MKTKARNGRYRADKDTAMLIWTVSALVADRAYPYPTIPSTLVGLDIGGIAHGD